MSGGSSSQTTNSNTKSYQTNTPAGYAEDYAVRGLEKSQELGDRSVSTYPYYYDSEGNQYSVEDWPDLVADLNSYQTQALDKLYNFSMNDNETIDNATNYLNDVLSGKYLSADSNPYLSDYVSKAQESVTDKYNKSTVPQLNAAASMSGAFGGTADTLLKSEAMNNLAKNLSDTATDIYYKSYSDERSNQQSALGQADEVNQMSIDAMVNALGVGDVYQQQEQSELNSLVNLWEYANKWPYYTAEEQADLFKTYGWGSHSEGESNTTSSTSGSRSSSGLTGGSILSGLGTALWLASSFFK